MVKYNENGTPTTKRIDGKTWKLWDDFSDLNKAKKNQEHLKKRGVKARVFKELYVQTGPGKGKMRVYPYWVYYRK